MDQDEPIFLLVAFAIAAYFAHLWRQDYQAAARGESIKAPLPGAEPVVWSVVAMAVVGALVILAAETGGEYALGVAGEQSKMSVLLGVYTLAAAFIEELIFRGFLFYDRGSRRQFWASIFAISVLFAVIHPHLWHFEAAADAPSWQFWSGQLSLTLNNKGVFSTSILFVNSLWFYWVRFCPKNQRKSLIPCVAAHFASNLGVFAIKAVQGHVDRLY